MYRGKGPCTDERDGVKMRGMVYSVMNSVKIRGTDGPCTDERDGVQMRLCTDERDRVQMRETVYR